MLSTWMCGMDDSRKEESIFTTFGKFDSSRCVTHYPTRKHLFHYNFSLNYV